MYFRKFAYFSYHESYFNVSHFSPLTTPKAKCIIQLKLDAIDLFDV